MLSLNVVKNDMLLCCSSFFVFKRDLSSVPYGPHPCVMCSEFHI